MRILAIDKLAEEGLDFHLASCRWRIHFYAGKRPVRQVHIRLAFLIGNTGSNGEQYLHEVAGGEFEHTKAIRRCFFGSVPRFAGQLHRLADVQSWNILVHLPYERRRGLELLLHLCRIGIGNVGKCFRSRHANVVNIDDQGIA